MAKTDDRASQYVFVEDEDIFAEDEQLLASRKKEVGGLNVAGSSSSVTHSVVKKESNPLTSRFRHDPVVLKRDAAKLRRALKFLSAIPPPPSITNPQFTLHDIISLWNRHNYTSELKTKWQPGLIEERLGHDIYLNTNNYVEELEHLRPELVERFVSNETASHLTFTSPLVSEHAKELQRCKGMLKSSGSHLNNMSQRKNFFNQFSSSSVRTFHYDNKKASFLMSHSESKISSKSHNYQALFHSPKKQVVNSHPTPSNQSSASSSYYSSMPPSNYSVPSAASSTSSSSSCSILLTPSRRLLSAGSGYVSQRSEKLVSSAIRSGDSSSKKSCNKNLKFDDQQHSDKSVKKPKKLSQLHGKKMLWAVETLLKSEGVVNTDPEYKTLYANIYRETTQVWLKFCEKRENGKYRDSVTGTSDLMVSVAKKLLPDVEQKLSISCCAIKARKETAKKNQEITFSTTKDENLCRTTANVSEKACINGVPARAKELNEKSSLVIEETVFSPEMLGVSNLCEGIDAVISSLDDLPPDPGDESTSAQANPSNTVSVVVPPINSKDDILSSSVDEVNVVLPVTVKSSVPLLTSSLIHPKSAVEKKPDGTTTYNVSLSAENSSSQQVHKNEVVDLPNLKMNCKNVSTVDNKNVASKQLDFTKDTAAEVVLETSPNTVSSKEDFTKVTVETNASGEPESSLCKIPVCIVKLERCNYHLTESVKTPEHVDSSGSGNRSSSLTPSNSVVNSSGGKKKMNKGKLKDVDSPCKSNSSSDRRRSKRKRSLDVSSCENTPTSSSIKTPTGKKLCSNQITNEILASKETIENKTESLRRCGKNKLSLDSVKKESFVDQDNNSNFEFENITPFQSAENLSEQNYIEGDIQTVIHQGSCMAIEKSNRCSVEHSNDTSAYMSDEVRAVAVLQQGEPSSSEIKVSSPKNIDKENDSSMENISDVDNQNWSPILKLKRSSKDLWSSELKKKRITSRRKRGENTENTSVTSPFLDLEGPFKYRFCKRARPGDFVSAVIRGEIYSKIYRKLVKRKNITKDCVLVRTVKEGLELRIPLELLKKEPIFFGPNKFQNMISDIVEDAICKLEGFESDTAFNGFTLHDVNQAAMTSSVMERTLKVIEQTGGVVKPLFTMYKYALVKQSPQNFQHFYQIFVEILRTSLFLRKTIVDHDTIQVRPLKTESPKKIQLEINIPVNLIGKNNRFKENILKDLTPIHNIISC